MLLKQVLFCSETGYYGSSSLITEPSTGNAGVLLPYHPMRQPEEYAEFEKNLRIHALMPTLLHNITIKGS